MDQKHTWLVKVFSVIAAFSLWLYISSLDNNEFNQRIIVPVTLQGLENVKDQKLKILPPTQPYEVTLNVSGSLTDIAFAKDKIKAVADFSEFVFTKGERTIPVRIESQPDNITISNSSVLSIKAVFDELKEKNLPIKLNIDGKVKDGYFALASNLSPSDVVVSGAAKFIDQIDRIQVDIDLKNTDKDLSLKLPLKAVDAAGREVKNIEIIPDSVDLTIPVRKTKTVSIEVKTKGEISKDYYLKSLLSIPDKVDIAGGENVGNISILETEPVDLSTLTPNKVVVVKIKPVEGISFINSDGTVKVKAVMEKIISKTFSPEIQIKKSDSKFDVSLDNNKLTIVVSGAESQVNALKNEDFNCFVDVSSITTEGEHSVKVNYTIPEGVNKVSASLENVKTTIKKKAEQPTNTVPTQPTQPTVPASNPTT